MATTAQNTMDDATLLMRERILLFLKVMSGVHLFFAATMIVNHLFIEQGNNFDPFVLIGVSFPIIGFGLARMAKTGGALSMIELGVTVSILGFYFWRMTHAPRLSAEMPIIVCTLVLALRSAIVPSPPLRTAAVGGVFLLAYASFVKHIVNPVQDLEAGLLVWLAVVATSFIAVTVVTSRVIYGLHSRATRAEKLGQYRMERKLGEGGMGKVYLATHAMLQRETALKVLNDDGQSSQAAIARFRDEVQTTSKLTHPNTINIYDYGVTPDGRFYYAMDYLPGATLREVVQRSGPMSPERVVFVLKQIAGAMDEAHNVGVLHRDLKPSNVMLCERGGQQDTAIVLDFGLVSHVDNDMDEMNGLLVGTPSYMSPESILDPKSVDPRSDIYSLGGIAFFLLTGRPPFISKDTIELLCEQIADDPPSLDEMSPFDVPTGLLDIVYSCLAKSPADRPSSAGDLLDDLEALETRWTKKDRAAWWAAYGEVVLGLAETSSPKSGTL